MCVSLDGGHQNLFQWSEGCAAHTKVNGAVSMVFRCQFELEHCDTDPMRIIHSDRKRQVGFMTLTTLDVNNRQGPCDAMTRAVRTSDTTIR